MKIRTLPLIFLDARRRVAAFATDCRAIAAVEFAVIAPVMLTMFFGTVEFSNGVAANRKVTLVARTLSDLTSQTSTSVKDADLQNYFAAGASILNPYDVTIMNPTISEIYVDASKIAKIQWSTSATVSMVSGSPKAVLTTSAHAKGDVVSVPGALAMPGTYLIWTEVDYTYKPVIGYVMTKTGIPLHDVSYTRPRQTLCIDYPAVVSPTAPCTPVK
jgi:Flp pilus assembly protein TadG